MLTTEFLIASLIVISIPGTGVLFTVSTAINKGFKASLSAIMGCVTETLLPLTASILGFTIIINMSAILFKVMKIAGVIYLLYLAWTIWKNTGDLKIERNGNRESMFQIFLRGFLVNVLNPKHFVFFFAFMPQFITSATSETAYEMLTMGGIFILIATVVFIIYAVLASKIRHMIQNSPKTVQRVNKSFGLIFTVLALRLAMASQE